MRRKCLIHYWQVALLTIVANLLLFVTMVWDSYSSEKITLSGEKRILLSVPGTGESGQGSVSITEAVKSNPSTIISNSFKENPRESDPRENPQVSPDINPPTVLYNQNDGVFDKFRMFKTHAFSRTGLNWNQLSERNICLGVQTSIDRLYQIVELIDGWSGPMSISIFTPDMELAITMKYINLLTSCFPAIRDQASFHLVEPVDHPGVQDSELLNEVQHDQVPCADHVSYLKRMLSYRPQEMMSWRESYSYPQNLLRNVAKNTCQTNFTYIPDIDMVLPKGMDEELEKFFSTQNVRECTKCAFVVPTYEIADSLETTPQNKSQLLDLKRKGLAQAFHVKLFKTNQQSSNLKAWEALPLDKPLDVAYKVNKYIFKYEPLYIARADTPQFDERFIGFGMTRNTQVYEMYVAGYEFYLLNNVFTNHWGFQSLKSRANWRAKQQERNNAKFDEFAKELSAHYGRDPYDMIAKLPKMNLKHIHVAYQKKAAPAPRKA